MSNVAWDETERIAELLAALPPAPHGWAAAAQELPSARASLDGLLARAREDSELRARLLDDLEGALAGEGVSPTPAVISLARISLDR